MAEASDLAGKLAKLATLSEDKLRAKFKAILEVINSPPAINAEAAMKAHLDEIDEDLLSEKGKIVRGYSIDAWKAYMRVLQPQDVEYLNREVIEWIEKGDFDHFEAVFLGRFEDEATFRLSAQYYDLYDEEDDEDDDDDDVQTKWVQSDGYYFCAVPDVSYCNSGFWEIGTPEEEAV
jgi:hypothetical protein